MCFFCDVGCYLFIGTYARLIFRVRAHNFSLRGSLGGDRLPTQAYARKVLCIFLLNMPRYPQSQQHFRIIAHPFTKAVHDPIIALKTMKRKRAMCLFIGCLEHIWGIPGHESFRLRVAYFSPTQCLCGEAPLFSDFGHAHFEA